MRARGRVERILAVVGATAILIVGFDSATYAATGSSLLLGRVNKAGGVTTVKNSGAGAALKLVTRSSASPPFTTNAKGLVKNLYADRAGTADRLSGSALAQVRRTIGAPTAVHLVGATGEPAFFMSLPGAGGPDTWGSYGSGFSAVSFRKDQFGVVNLGGLLCPRFPGVGGVYSCFTITVDVFSNVYSPVFTLPEGFRPSARTVFSIRDTDHSGRIDVLPNGEVQVLWDRGVHGFMALDGISFLAAP